MTYELAARRKAAIIAALNSIGGPAYMPEIYEAYCKVPEAPTMTYKQVNALLYIMANKGLLSKGLEKNGKLAANYQPFNGTTHTHTAAVKRKYEKKAATPGLQITLNGMTMSADEAVDFYRELHKLFGRKP